MPRNLPLFRSAIAAELDAVHRNWGWLLAWGVLLLVSGLVALTYPIAATVVSVQVFGVLLLIAAGGQLAAAFHSRGWGGVLVAILVGFLYFVGGVILLERPLGGAIVYTVFIAMLLFAVGIVRIASAMVNRFSGWGWTVISGIMSVLLAVLIWQDFPENALWVIGLFVGIDLIFAGVSWIMLALAAKGLPAAPSVTPPA
jgi:uncharacterized membrane protein HdeD (DUF308 family)